LKVKSAPQKAGLWFNKRVHPKIDLSTFNFKPGIPILVAVSGGPDSLALLHFLRASSYPLICATFNHRLRPEAADEVAHVRQIAENLGLPFVTDSADVAAYAAAEGLSVEEAARALRYRFLFRAAREAGAQAVATGHTADDQAETVLMHFLRGAGLSGLKGMPYRSVLPVFDLVPGAEDPLWAGYAEIPLVRPLLGWWRADTEAYCREHGLSPIYDPTNADTTYFRNRLRHNLIPELENYNPRFKEALVRATLALQGDDALLAEVIDSAWQKSILEQGAGFVAFKKSALEKLSPALRRNLFKRAAFLLRPGLRDVDFAALERAAALQPVDLAGGLRLFYETGKIYLAAYEADLPSADWPQVKDGKLVGWELVTEIIIDENLFVQARENGDPFTAWLDADSLAPPAHPAQFAGQVAGVTEDRLRLRTVRVGDRFQPLGMPGASVKLQDFFVNNKLPKRARKNWPLVCAGNEIAWVTGLRLAHPFRVTEKTKRVLRLQIKRLP
jgi:tRNA(Ile)-lysidine synthase